MKAFPLVLAIGLTTMSNLAFGQQHFLFKYKLDKSLNTNGKVFEIIEGSKRDVKTWTGFIEANKILKGTNPSLDTLSVFTYRSKVEKKQRTINQTIFGSVKLNDDKDTLTITPWFTSPGNNLLLDEKGNPLDMNNDNGYVLAIEKWNLTSNGYPYLDLPYTFQQLTATNIPLRLNLKTGQIQSDFLNINLSYLWIKGTTRFFKSKFVEKRNRYVGIGPYIGGSTVEENDKKLFGINYGANAVFSVYNVSLVLALGAETAIKSDTNKFNPYAGLGLGLKLSDMYDPSDE